MSTKSMNCRNVVRAALGAVIVAAALASTGCGGSAGVENGGIHGRVFGNASGGSSADSPLSGVTVVVKRESGTPELIRTYKTNASGDFVANDLPPGKYALGFAFEGFRTITTEEGNTKDQTAIGNQVRVFVEAGSTAEAPDVVLRALAQQGESTVVFTLIDDITGQPVTHATVSIGAAVTSDGGSNGVYTLSVPVNVDEDALAGTPPSLVEYRAVADGYDTGAWYGSLRPIAGQTIRKTLGMVPDRAKITGRVLITGFDTLYDKTSLTVTCDTVPRDFLGTSPVEASGYFTVEVPASNQFLTRQFNLTFNSAVLQSTTVSNVVAPRSGGTRQLTSPVNMNPITVDVIGTVADSSGHAPNQLNPSGLPDTVTIKETGQVANIVNGAYTIPSVPSCSAQEKPQTLTFTVSAYNPTGTSSGGGVGAVESAELQGSPLSDGSANPTFTVPLITTTSGGSGS